MSSSMRELPNLETINPAEMLGVVGGSADLSSSPDPHGKYKGATKGRKVRDHGQSGHETEVQSPQ